MLCKTMDQSVKLPVVESNVGNIMGDFCMFKVGVQWADSYSRNALQTGSDIANGVHTPR